MTLVQVLQVLWARRWVALGVFAGVVVAVAATSLLLPRIYVASTQLVVDQRSVDPVTGNSVQTQSSSEYLATQVDVIGSHNVAAKVVDRYKLTDLPVVREQYLRATHGAGNARDWLAERMLDDLDVVPSRESSVITVSYASTDARFAAQMANAFADAYIQTNLELKTEPAKRQALWYDDQVAQLRLTLQEAQRKLAAYQQQKGLVGADNREDTEAARLGDLNAQLATAQGTLADAQSRLKQLDDARASGKLEQLPDILGNGLIQSMKADLARAEGKLADLGERYGTGHPGYAAALAEANSLRTRLRAEIETVTGATRQGVKLAQQRVAELTASIDAQKARILQLKQGNDMQSVLQQDVDNAQRAYDAAQQRAAQVKMQSQLEQTSIAVLNPALVPDRPSRPRVLVNIAIGLFFGAVLGIAAALLLELFDRRVRSQADVAEHAGVDVLAEVPS